MRKSVILKLTNNYEKIEVAVNISDFFFHLISNVGYLVREGQGAVDPISVFDVMIVSSA